MSISTNGYLDKPIVGDKDYTSSGDTSIFHIDLVEKEQILIYDSLFVVAVVFLILVYFIIKYFTSGKEKQKMKKMIIYSLIVFIISSSLLIVWFLLNVPHLYLL